MTPPIIPGIGDTLRQNLPGIARNIRSIIDPTADAADALKEALSKNPQLAQNLAELTYDNPDMLKPLFGEKANNYIQSIKPSQEFLNNRAFQEAEANLTPAQRKESTLHRLGIKTDDEQAVFDLNKQRLQQEVAAGKYNLDQLEQKGALFQHAVTSGLATKSVPEIISAYKSGDLKAKDIEALYTFAPDAMARVFAQMVDENNFEQQKSLAQMQMKYGTKSSMNQMAMIAGKHATDLNLNAAAYVAALYGDETAHEVYPTMQFTEVDKKYVKQRIDQEAAQDRLARGRDMIDAISKLSDPKVKPRDKQAAVEYFNAQAQVRNIPIQASYDPGGIFGIGSGIKYINTITKKPVDPELVQTQVGKAVSAPDTNAPAGASASRSSLSPTASKTLNDFNNIVDAQKPAALAKLKQVSPDIYNEIAPFVSGVSDSTKTDSVTNTSTSQAQTQTSQTPEDKYNPKYNLTRSEIDFAKALNLKMSNADIIKYKLSLGFKREEEIPDYLLNTITKYKLKGNQISAFLSAKPNPNLAPQMAEAVLNIPSE